MEYLVLGNSDLARLFKSDYKTLNLKPMTLKGDEGQELKNSFVVSMVGWPTDLLHGLRRLRVSYTTSVLSDEVHVHPLAQIAEDQGKVCLQLLREKHLQTVRPNTVRSTARKEIPSYKSLSSSSGVQAQAQAETLRRMQAEEDSSEDEEPAQAAGSDDDADMGEDEAEAFGGAKMPKIKKVRADPTADASVKMAALNEKQKGSKRGGKAQAQAANDGKDKDPETGDGKSSAGGCSRLLQNPAEFAAMDAEMALVSSRYTAKTNKEAPSLTQLNVADALRKQKKSQAVTGVPGLSLIKEVTY